MSSAAIVECSDAGSSWQERSFDREGCICPYPAFARTGRASLLRDMAARSASAPVLNRATGDASQSAMRQRRRAPALHGEHWRDAALHGPPRRPPPAPYRQDTEERSRASCNFSALSRSPGLSAPLALSRTLPPSVPLGSLSATARRPSRAGERRAAGARGACGGLTHSGRARVTHGGACRDLTRSRR